MDHPVISPKKLIEVALPLDAINAAAGREKSIRHGHPSMLHLWWARRPLAAARAVIFSQLVHDPEDLWRCQNPDKEPNAQVKGHWTKARAKLFNIIEDLVRWENTTNETVLERAREVIRQSWHETCELNQNHPDAATLFDPDHMPGLHDPFAGGGAIPLEAQRLGLEANASDLNPVAVLINKAMIEIPPKFFGMPPVSQTDQPENTLLGKIEENWRGAAGLAQDVRFYGQWIRDEAAKRIGHLYPQCEITSSMVKERPDLKPYIGENLTVIAWIWARTVHSPNPAFSQIKVPLASTFVLSSKDGKEAYIQPELGRFGYSFSVQVGKPTVEAKAGTTLGKQKGFRCLMSQTPIPYEYIREEAISGRMGQKLMAIVAEGTRGRIYLSPYDVQENIADTDFPSWKPDLKIPKQALGFRVQLYGMSTFGELFTSRQRVALTTFSELVAEAKERIFQDAVKAGVPDDKVSLSNGGKGANAYAEAVCLYLAFVIGRGTDYWSSITTWYPGNQQIGHAFTKQALPMVWDFAEANPLSTSSGSWRSLHHTTWDGFKGLPSQQQIICGVATQEDAQQVNLPNRYISTDPPYYDNIGYADLSDFFYVWLRKPLRDVFPDLLSTISVPKNEELVATPHRHGNKKNAEKFFLEGMTNVMKNLALQAHPSAPITIYYAFKQAETKKGSEVASTGWSTFLEAVFRSGLAVTGTWPLRSEQHHRMIAQGTNALASSIILVCRPRQKNAGVIDRRKFQRLLNETLPLALDAMTRESEGLHSPVAPVDLSQAIIGPGMAIYSRYDAVLEADGSLMSVKTALQLINRFLAEDDFDADTQFCLHWFEQYGWETSKYGEADTLARAKGTSVDGMKQAGVLHAAAGNVRLLKWGEYPSDWDPRADQRIPIWEVLHQLIRVFNTDGETGAAAVFAAVQSKAEAARQLAYRLYTLCERKNWAEDARAYNEVVTSWSGIEAAAAKEPSLIQRDLFE